jgi:RNA polymerase-binding protein DksA
MAKATASKKKAPAEKADKKDKKATAVKPVEKVAEKPSKAREYNERSNGSTPVTLHHRKLTKSELEEFRQLLLTRRRQLMGDVEEMEKEAFSDETKTLSMNHIADSSSEQYEQDFTLHQIENESEELREINRALDKIDAGNYGVCEATGEFISVERLRAMPYTRITMAAREKFEREGGGHEYGVHPESRI